MSSIAVGKQLVHYQPMTRICGNCIQEERTRDERRDRTQLFCKKHGWFVLMSATCMDHEYKERGNR